MTGYITYTVVLRSRIAEFTVDVVAKSPPQAVILASRKARKVGLTDTTWKLESIKPKGEMK